MRILFFIIAFCVVCLTGCHEKIWELDVKKEKVTNKTEDWQINLDYSVFSSSNPSTNESCEILNKKVRTLVAVLQDSLKTAAADLFQSLEKTNIPRPSWNCSLFVTDSVFMATNKYISMRLTVYTFTGGAHGINDFYAFNYDVENQKMLSVGDIIEQSDLEPINRLLKSHFKNTENCFNTDPTLDQATTINFTPADVCFTYAQYKLGPYVCGAPEVTVPLTELKGMFLLAR
jgi:hypothetical protein